MRKASITRYIPPEAILSTESRRISYEAQSAFLHMQLIIEINNSALISAYSACGHARMNAYQGLYLNFMPYELQGMLIQYYLQIPPLFKIISFNHPISCHIRISYSVLIASVYVYMHQLVLCRSSKSISLTIIMIICMQNLYFVWYWVMYYMILNNVP